MAANWKLVQAFIREVTEDENFQPISDIALAYAKLRQLQRGHFSAVTENGLTQIASTVGETSFTFAVPDGLGTSEIIQIAETALELIEGKTVAAARAILVRRKTTRPDFTGFRP